MAAPLDEGVVDQIVDLVGHAIEPLAESPDVG